MRIGKAFGCSLSSHNLYAICFPLHDSESIREITYIEACLWCVYRIEDRIYFHTWVRAAGWDQCFTPLAMKKGILRDKERSSSPLPCKDLTSQLTWVWMMVPISLIQTKWIFITGLGEDLGIQWQMSGAVVVNSIKAENNVCLASHFMSSAKYLICFIVGILLIADEQSNKWISY